MASSENLEAYLFDYENGTTTKQFVKELKKKCKITFLDFNTLDTQNILPLVLIVRSTTERAEEDVDAALKKASGIRCPIIIVYFHMKGLSDCLKTENCVRGNDKYKHIPAIIDMDFSKGRLKLNTVNSSAIVCLQKLIKDLKDGTFESEENKSTLYVYDKSKTEMSKKVRNELERLMKGKLQIKTAETPCSSEPLLVIFNVETLASKEDGMWKEIKDCDPSNNIMICLYDEEDGDMLAFKGAPVADTIDIKLSSDMSCVLTFIICERLLAFVSNYHLRMNIRRNKTGKQNLDTGWSFTGVFQETSFPPPVWPEFHGTDSD